MTDKEELKRFAEAKNCSDCLCWHKYCKAECCKLVLLNIDLETLKTDSKYLIMRVDPMSPSEQRYYQFRDVRYTRGTLRFQKDRIHLFGKKIFYVYPCKHLDENNLCKIHFTSKPKLCKLLTLETAYGKSKDFTITDNCLFKYKKEEGGKNGKE